MDAAPRDIYAAPKIVILAHKTRNYQEKQVISAIERNLSQKIAQQRSEMNPVRQKIVILRCS
ncbi:hypothetical protein [Novosphingobium sp. PhB57]|uniref:hypothetical protein n=1 Tax=Novosphingobium sp. PhB57 TaxID=2485107 RepID=UPI00104F81EB|nr:hypothetical protein [Novosphingobium sp. PhB57]